MKEENKCYCGHTTYCDCGPEQEIFYNKEKVENIVYNIVGAIAFHQGVIIDGAKLNELFEQFKKK